MITARYYCPRYPTHSWCMENTADLGPCSWSGSDTRDNVSCPTCPSCGARVVDRDAPSQRQPIPVVRPGQAERIEVARKLMTLAAMHEQLGGPHGTAYLVHPTAAVLELAQSFAEDQPDAVGAYEVYPDSGPPSHILRIVINSTTIEIFGLTTTETIRKSVDDRALFDIDCWTREQAAQRNLGVVVMMMAVSPDAPR